MDAKQAESELEYVRSILDRAQRRLDPHAFHFVAWGISVLVWYPLENLFRAQDRPALWSLVLAVAAIASPVLYGMLRERRIALTGERGLEDAAFSRQVSLACTGSIGPAALLSFVGPAFGFIDGPYVPIVWGFAYVVLAWTLGVVYDRSFLWAAGWIFAGAVAALAFPVFAGAILGPAMGLGMIVPGYLAERRIRDRETVRGAAA